MIADLKYMRSDKIIVSFGLVKKLGFVFGSSGDKAEAAGLSRSQPKLV